MEFFDAFARWQKKQYHKICLSVSNDCSEGIARCHTLSSAASLGKIAIEGHVAEFDFKKGNVKFKKRGVSVASTFTGFCSYHDGNIFSPIDNIVLERNDVLSNECLLLYNLRATAKELWSKINSEKFYEKTIAGVRRSPEGFKLREDNRSNLEANIEFLHGHLEGTKKGIEELNRSFLSCKEILRSENFHLYRRKEFIVDLPLSLCVSQIITPIHSLRGERLLEVEESDWALFYLHVFPYNDHARIIFSWHKRFDNIISRFLRDFTETYSRNIQEFQENISLLICAYSENPCFRLDYVNTWSDIDQQKYLKLFQRTMFNTSNLHLEDKPNLFVKNSLYR